MRLFDFVEEHDRIRTAAHLLGELAAFFVADVAGRRADQARDGVLLHVLGHVDAHHGVLVVEQKFGESAGEFGFADAGRPEENERADGALGIAEPGAGAADGVGHALERPSWPTTRWRRRSSMLTSFLTSPSSIFETGMPVHLETMRAMSSSSTSSFSMRLPAWLVHLLG